MVEMRGEMNPFPAYKTVSVGKLVPYARNSRTHSPQQVDKIAASIREFGFLNPIIVDGDNGIIAGHGRVMAAQKLGLADLPVIEASHLTEAQRRAYVIADNRLALDAGWDNDLLKVELQDLDSQGFDLTLTGFELGEIGNLLAEATEGLTDADAVPDVPAVPVAVEGDVWLLGRHRLMCGDSTSIDAVERLMAGVKPHLMVTDPPYGVNYDPQIGAKRAGIKSGVTGKVLNDDNADWSDAWALFQGSVAYVWHAGTKSHIVADSLISNGFDIKGQIIWSKTGHILSRTHYHLMHEPCWYAVRGDACWQGARDQDSVWRIGKDRKGDDKQTNHGTQKPVEVMLRPILNNSSVGQAIYEPFCGSGTTLIASEKSGRCCLAMELDPKYCDVIITRWQDFTGQQATLEATGQTFEELKQKREAA
jgi:DNA modification methylase